MCIPQDQPAKPLMPLISDMFIVICLFYMISPLSVDVFDIRHVYCYMFILHDQPAKPLMSLISDMFIVKCILQDQPTKLLVSLMSDMFIVICVFYRISPLSR